GWVRDWSSDVCSSDLLQLLDVVGRARLQRLEPRTILACALGAEGAHGGEIPVLVECTHLRVAQNFQHDATPPPRPAPGCPAWARSEERRVGKEGESGW